MHYVMLIKANNYKEVERKMRAFELFGANGTESKYVKEIDETDSIYEDYKQDLKEGKAKESFKEYAEYYTDYELYHVSTNMDEIDVEDKKWGYILYDDNDQVVKIIKRDNPNGRYDYYSHQHPFAAYYIKNGKRIAFGIDPSNENYISFEEYYTGYKGDDFYHRADGISISEIDLTTTFNYLYKKCRYEYDVVKELTKGLKYKPLEYFIKKEGLSIENYSWLKEEYKAVQKEYEKQELYRILSRIAWSREEEYKNFDRELCLHPLIVYSWTFEEYFEYKRSAFFNAYGYIHRGKWITSNEEQQFYKGEKASLKKRLTWAKEIKSFIFEKEEHKKIFVLDVHR